VIKSTLRHIRQKPKAVREQYAFWIACTCTGIVAIVWATQLSGRFTDQSQQGSVADSERPETFSSFMQETQSAIETVTSEVQQLTEVVSTPASQPPAVATTSTSTVIISDTPAPAPVPTPKPRTVRIATSTSQ